MASMQCCWFVGAILCVLLRDLVESIPTEANVDMLEPALIRSPATSQDPDDGFGWAAILHQTEPVLRDDSISEAIRKTRVIIGAPRGSYPGGLNLADPELAAAERTGLVYSCPVGPGDCEGVRGDTARYIGGAVDITNGFQNRRSETNELFDQPIAEGRLFDQAPDSESVGGRFNVRLRVERKSGQMMGSVLYSTGDNIVACAPRWVVNPFITGGSQPRGICFSGDRQLENFRSELPCSGIGFSQSSGLEGYCSAGVSVTILGDQIHIGAPGYGQFGGAVYSRPLADPITSPYSRTINHLNEMIGRPIYHGIQVASGYVTSNNREQGPLDLLVASSRDNETLYIGRVYMYSIATLNTIQTTPVAQGAQMAEFFGYSMVLCDLTGDGYDELLVGAPMYTFLPEARGIDRRIMPEIGRVYVFYNTGGSLDFDPVILEGFVARSRFGLTVAKLGDIDADGREDVAIGAPYEESLDLTANTGAVYVYYGKETREEFRSQTPVRIHGDDIVNNVENLTSFRTFGFSISGNVDVDNNQYSDMVVGGYSDQAVVVLRSLPVANVTVRFGAIPEIRVDGPEPSFEVTLTASYDAIQVPGPLTVPFTLSEVLVSEGSRLFFTRGDPGDVQYDGTFTLLAPNIEASQMLTVYARSDFAETRPYQLQLDLSDVKRTTPSVVDGQQPISDLSAFPHIRQGGDNMAMVNLINPCGDDGCQSDIAFTIPTPSTSLMLLQGQDRSITFVLNYTNFGGEEARNVRLSISDFPDPIFPQIILSPKGQENTRFDCVRNDTGGVMCPLHERFLANQGNSLVLTLVVDRNGFIGNEDDFSVTLNIVVDMSSNNTDVNTTNNEVRIPFSVASESNINVAVFFGSDRYSYTGKSSSTLNQGSLVTLFVTVDNTGPSTIQRASININFPSRVSMDTNPLFYLYPNRILGMGGSAAVGTSVSCSTMGIDPNDLNGDADFTFQLNNRRRRRSLPTGLRNKNAKGSFRMRRQTPAIENLISCNTHLCVNVICNIQGLGTDGITFTVEFNVDERFYASADGEDYSIRAEASAFVGDGFQVMNDDPSDNSGSATVVLFEVEDEVMDSLELIHVVVWPTIGAVIILILFVTLLYYLGFFKRKTREEDEEVEDETVTKVVPDDAAEITGL